MFQIYIHRAHTNTYTHIRQSAVTLKSSYKLEHIIFPCVECLCALHSKLAAITNKFPQTVQIVLVIHPHLFLHSSLFLSIILALVLFYFIHLPFIPLVDLSNIGMNSSSLEMVHRFSVEHVYILCRFWIGVIRLIECCIACRHVKPYTHTKHPTTFDLCCVYTVQREEELLVYLAKTSLIIRFERLLFFLFAHFWIECCYIDASCLYTLNSVLFLRWEVAHSWKRSEMANTVDLFELTCLISLDFGDSKEFSPWFRLFVFPFYSNNFTMKQLNELFTFGNS